MLFVPPVRHLLRAKDLVDARYSKRLSVDDLARAASFSRAHFSREFRRAFGESPNAYLLTRRLERAAALLRTTDQSVADEALAFYTQKLGFEIRADVTLPELGNFRWLTVGPAGQPNIAIVLQPIAGPPIMDADTAEQVRTLMAKGLAGTIFLTTDDCDAAYEELKGRGVEFVEQPEERPYGIDSSFRDPSGNHIRLTQVREFSAV
jgi:uncharacterized glyoxalase superfamily protein PhnB